MKRKVLTNCYFYGKIGGATMVDARRVFILSSFFHFFPPLYFFLLIFFLRRNREHFQFSLLFLYYTFYGNQRLMAKGRCMRNSPTRGSTTSSGTVRSTPCSTWARRPSSRRWPNTAWIMSRTRICPKNCRSSVCSEKHHDGINAPGGARGRMCQTYIWILF